MNKIYKLLVIILFSSIISIYYNLLDKPLFNKSVCVAITDSKGNLLGAHITDDEQWRFPQNDSVPYRFEKSIICYEDKKFYYHNGVDIMSLLRAFYINFKNKKIVSGGSTITMQVIRLSRDNPERTIIEKIYEILLAYKLDNSYLKKEILSLYSSNAPFGGNVVGLDAAAWRYFGRKPSELSWAESAMLAVLPNSPSLINLGKNRTKLKIKRNKLLKTLFLNNIIDNSTYEISILEEIPENPRPFPQLAPHLLNRIIQENKNSKRPIYNTSIISDYQVKTNNIVLKYYQVYSGNNINNIAAIVIDNKTNKVVSYVGNAFHKQNAKNGYQVDVINSKRSTGSILKPFLYCAMLSSGEIMPNSLIADIPIQIKGYSPKNYNRGYEGAIPASRAITRSLNVPAVKMLQQYGIEKFIYILQKLGISSIDKSSDFYGLTLILGGAEAKLYEIVSAYSSMARSLIYYSNKNSTYNSKNYSYPKYLNKKEEDSKIENENYSFLSASAIWYTFNTMIDVERPEEESNWEMFSSKQKIAWKTGTSFGFKDAWAVGVTPNYTVGVWVGNADGEGRPNLTGIKSAAPIMFEIFDFLPLYDNWFLQPFDDMCKLAVCQESGFLASLNCNNIDTVWLPNSSINFKPCPYHKIIHLDKNNEFRVNEECESVHNMNHISWFILPPTMEFYYKQRNPLYKEIPSLRIDCQKNNGDMLKIMEVIYPQNLSQIFIPIELDGKKGKCIFEVAHSNSLTTIYWHLDDLYLGETTSIHKFAIQAGAGNHILTLIDDDGNKMMTNFSIIDKNMNK